MKNLIGVFGRLGRCTGYVDSLKDHSSNSKSYNKIVKTILEILSTLDEKYMNKVWLEIQNMKPND